MNAIVIVSETKFVHSFQVEGGCFLEVALLVPDEL